MAENCPAARVDEYVCLNYKDGQVLGHVCETSSYRIDVSVADRRGELMEEGQSVDGIINLGVGRVRMVTLHSCIYPPVTFFSGTSNWRRPMKSVMLPCGSRGDNSQASKRSKSA